MQVKDFELDQPASDEEWAAWSEDRKRLPMRYRWFPTYGQRKLARRLYGSEEGKTAFIIGNGPSIADAELHLKECPPNSIRIAINAAITKVPAEYWFFIDGDAYRRDGGHPNVQNAKIVGSDRFWPIYSKDVFVWERAFEPTDIMEGKLVHRNTSLVAAMHFAAHLGCQNIFLIGCDNRLDPNKVYTKEQIDIQSNTYNRVARSIAVDMFYWAPKYLTAWDCSGGSIPLPKISLEKAIEAVHATSKAIRNTNQTVG